MKLFGFSVAYGFPLAFTREVWRADNPVLVEVLGRLERNRRHRALVVVDDQVAAAKPALIADIDAYFAAHASRLQLLGTPILVTGGEAVKNDLSHTLGLLARMNEAGLDRQSFVVIVGGGAVLDMASFAAALAHRGIRVVRIPTTVLSQADSAVGVKNGVNLFGKKNFAGTFVPPFGVINDVTLLETLPLRDRIAGVVEAVKVALLKDQALFGYIEGQATRVASGDLHVLEALIRRSAELHLAHICGHGDPFELGSARPLDFGHWAAHKLESLTAHRLRHGEAVAIGLALDLTYSVKIGLIDRRLATRILDLLEAIGFRLWDDALGARDASGQYAIIAGLQEFREHLGGELHVTLLRAIEDSVEVNDMDEALIAESIEELDASRRPVSPDLLLEHSRG